MARILHIALSLNPGGAERLVIELCRRLAGEFDSAVCCLDEEGAWVGELEGAGVEVTALNRRPGFRPLLARSIAQQAARHDVALVHCHQFSPFVYGTLAQLARPGLRVLLTEHGRRDNEAPSMKRRLGTRLLGLLPSEVVAVSGALRETLIAEGFPASRVRVVHSGVAPGPGPTPERRRRARERLGLAPDELVIGAVGRLDAVKDFATLVAAFERLRRHGLSARLVIVGDGSRRDELAALARAAGMNGAFALAGHLDDARELMPGFDLFVNSSIYEGISLTLLEAMAEQLPVVATRVGGTPEVVCDGLTGTLVPPRSPAALAAAMGALLADPGMRYACGCQGRTRVLDQFDISRMAGEYAEIYRRLGAR